MKMTEEERKLDEKWKAERVPQHIRYKRIRLKREVLSMPHLCDSCKKEFPTCDAKRVMWGIDKYPQATDAEADRVLECDGHEMKLVQPIAHGGKP